MKIGIDSKDFRVRPGQKVNLKNWPTKVKPICKTKGEYQQLLGEHVAELSALQRLYYACNRYALLLIFQGMDAAGKDGAIRHVMSGVNPQGCQVSSFKEPSASELEHDFLWRSTQRLPQRGEIGIFNRSYYEDVLILRVHPELLRGEGLAEQLGHGKNAEDIWESRYRSIVNLKATCIGTQPEPSRYSSIFLTRNSESASSNALMSRRRTGNSASRIFARGNIGSST
jgi:polyphosphate kinase 2 (PPK2 family)